MRCLSPALTSTGACLYHPTALQSTLLSNLLTRSTVNSLGNKTLLPLNSFANNQVSNTEVKCQ